MRRVPGRGIVATALCVAAAGSLVSAGGQDPDPARRTLAEVERLLDAAEHGNRAAALRLLTRGADPNTPGPDGPR